jgi:hypothetical protein
MFVLKIVRNQKSRHRLDHTPIRPHADTPVTLAFFGCGFAAR